MKFCISTWMFLPAPSGTKFSCLLERLAGQYYHKQNRAGFYEKELCSY